MAQSTFNLDDEAFSISTNGVIQPCDIQMLQAEEEDAIVDPQIFQPIPDALQEREQAAAASDTEDRLLDSVMALANDLPTFREFESYRFDRAHSNSDTDSPEDYYSSEDESLEAIPIEGDSHGCTGRPESCL